MGNLKRPLNKMGGDADNPDRNSSSDERRRRRSHTHFPVGSLVEVRTNEKGLKGVYFSATVIPPPPSTTISPTKKSKKRIFIEYDNLLADENGPDRLREYVNVSLVRPAPPPLMVGGFEVGDVVDAFYKDGWWNGVVSSVVEGGGRVVVKFRNPAEKLEFGIAEVRAHWEWVNGSWVKKEKKSVLMSMHEVGRNVEVSFEREGFQDAFFPAIIHQDLGNGIFLVKCLSSNAIVNEDNNEDEAIAKVDLLHVRPCPPLLLKKKFVLLEKVDAFFDFGWWSGVITKEIENGSGYVVFFEQLKRDKEFGDSELRPHMEWKDGKWLLPSLLSSLDDEGVGEHEHHQSSSGASAATASSVVDDGKDLYSLTSRKQLTPDNQEMSLAKRRRHHLCDSGTALEKPNEGNVVQAKHDDEPIKQVLCGVVNNMEASAAQSTMGYQSSWGEQIGKKQKNVRAKLNVFERRTRRKLPRACQEKGLKESVWLGESGGTSEKIAVQVQDFPGGTMMQVNHVDKVVGEVAINEFDDEPLSKRIEEMQHSPSLIDGMRLSPVDNVEQCIVDAEKQRDDVVLDDEDSGRQASAFVDKGSVLESSPPCMENTDVIVLLDKDREKQQPEIGTEADSAYLDKCCTTPSEMQSLHCVENVVSVALDKNGEKLPESGTRAAAFVDKGSILPNQLQSLPFVKNKTSLWKTIESMQVFQRIPQKPHFQPLKQFKEILREGLAIGYMVTFAILVERTCRLQLNDPTSIIDDIMEVLADLELHGFDVTLVQDRLNKLLAAKDKEEKLVDEVKNFKNQILNHNHEKTRIEEEIREISEQMRKLQEKFSVAELAKEKKDDEIASLQARLKEIDETIKNLRCDFEGVVSSIL